MDLPKQAQTGGRLDPSINEDFVDELFVHWYATQAYLSGQVDRPNEGCTESEMAARAGLPFRAARDSPGFVERLMPGDMEWVPMGADFPLEDPAEAVVE